MENTLLDYTERYIEGTLGKQEADALYALLKKDRRAREEFRDLVILKFLQIISSRISLCLIKNL